MTTVNVTEARANLYKLIDDTSESHEPIVITGKRAEMQFSWLKATGTQLTKPCTSSQYQECGRPLLRP